MIIRTTTLLLLSLLLSGCATSYYAEEARTDRVEANMLLRKVVTDKIIVLTPTFSDKVKAVRNIGNDKAAAKVEQEAKDYALQMISSFNTYYNVGAYVFMPDSAFHRYAVDQKGTFFLDNNAELDPSIQYQDADPIKVILYDEYKLRVLYGQELAPNPFPNEIEVGSNVYSVFFTSTADKLNKAVEVFNEKLLTFVSN